MIRVTVLYPAAEGATFDMDYYLNRHCPMVREVLGGVLQSLTVDKGISGPLPGSPAPFTVLCHLVFESPESFLGAMRQHGGRIMEDIPNYTSVSPTIQVSEILS